MHRIMYACSTGAARLFRMNVGMAWAGDAQRFTRAATIRVGPGDVLVRNARPFHSGHEGMHDLIGWRTVEVTPEMVGLRLAVYASLEVKGEGGRVREAQYDWLEAVKRGGGIAGIVRSEAEAVALMQGDLRKAIDNTEAGADNRR
jgi:hypothetical protein